MVGHTLLLALEYGKHLMILSDRTLTKPSHFSDRLPAKEIGMIVDRGNDFPGYVQQKLDSYGSDMWHFRDGLERNTTRALNLYRGEHRG